MKTEERFLKYVQIDTESDPYSETTPSTMKQKDLAKVLVEEMKALGIEDAMMDEFGRVYGSIPANTDVDCEAIGFIAHMDTSPDCSGKNVKPRIVEKYDGSTIVLNEELNVSMEPKEFSALSQYIGDDLIVTDGTTLLGADDKAGVAEIMTMAETLLNHPEIKHGRIAIAFTCDEEVGRGADDFDLKRFACDYAYTVDGGDIDCIDYENFNAAAAVVTVHGKSIHPGSSKNKMVNAILVAYEFHNCLNVFENPACTEGYDGFNHMTEINGACEKAVMHYIIRNHDEDKMAHQKAEFENARDFLNKKYGYEIIELDIQDSYANMRQCIEKDMRCVERAKKAMLSVGIPPRSTAIRGGTDGARLTYDGLNCPNLGTGGANYHGKYEFASIQAMNKISELLVRIASIEA